MVDDAEACLSRNVDFNIELKRNNEDLWEVEDSHEKAKELAEENAKKLEGSRAALLACMQEAKVAIDDAFVKGGAESSGCYPRLILLCSPCGFRRS